jgi:acyl-CoA synthetase (AMP-forming)/AMP-acid ligase II
LTPALARFSATFLVINVPLDAIVQSMPLSVARSIASKRSVRSRGSPPEKVSIATPASLMLSITVKAWVVVKPGETVTEEEIREYCKKNMASFKVPTQVEFRSELPKTTVGKVLRRELVREHMEKVNQNK